MFKHLSRLVLGLEAINADGETIVAGKKIVSKSPGTKGKEGKVLSITKDTVLVQFDFGAKMAIPLNHVHPI